MVGPALRGCLRPMFLPASETTSLRVTDFQPPLKPEMSNPQSSSPRLRPGPLPFRAFRLVRAVSSDPSAVHPPGRASVPVSPNIEPSTLNDEPAWRSRFSALLRRSLHCAWLPAPPSRPHIPGAGMSSVIRLNPDRSGRRNSQLPSRGLRIPGPAVWCARFSVLLSRLRPCSLSPGSGPACPRRPPLSSPATRLGQIRSCSNQTKSN